ncbi:MAG: cell division protein FtsX [Mangrovibacterium sp.]
MKRKRRARIKWRLLRSYLVSALSITLVLFLMGLLSLLLLNARQLSDSLRENVGFTLILDEGLSELEVLRLQKSLCVFPGIRSVHYVDREEAARELSRELGENFTGFLGFNPLFASMAVRLEAPWMQADSLELQERRFLGLPGVREVDYQRDLVQRLNENVRRLGLFLLVLAVLLLLIFISLINNTIRMAVYSRRFVIHTMKLVGASRPFIRAPFVRRGVGCGLGAGLLAGGLLAVLVWSFRQELNELNPGGPLFYARLVRSLGISFALVLLAGLFISWLSTRLAVNKFLRMEFDELFY